MSNSETTSLLRQLLQRLIRVETRLAVLMLHQGTSPGTRIQHNDPPKGNV